MSASVVSLRDWIAPKRDWSQRELAEFYRVESALLQAGLRLETDRGLTDEGDPWFVFCREDDGEVFAHFARLGSEYILIGPAFGGAARGRDFSSLVQDLISRHPLVETKPRSKSNVFMHPAALLIAVVGTAFFKTGEAKAADFTGDGGERATRRHLAGGVSPVAVSEGRFVAADANQTLAVVASAMSVLGQARAAPAAAQTAPGQALAPSPVSDTQLASSSASRSAALPTTRGAAPPTEGHSALVAQAHPAELASMLSLASVLAEVADGPTVGRSDTAPMIAPLEGPPTQAKPVFLIEVAPGPLPEVTAVHFLTRVADAGDAPTVVMLEKLPDFLSQLIERGLHLNVVATPGAAMDVPVAPATEPPPVIPELPPVAFEPPAASPDAPPPAPATDTATPIPASPPAAGQPPAVGGSVVFLNAAQEDQLERAIAYFLSHTPQSQTIVTGDDVVMYDSRMIHDTSLLLEASSVTFNFADGSSISLVGIPAALSQAIYLPHGS